MISQANRRPGHAAYPSFFHPVEAIRPHIHFSNLSLLKAESIACNHSQYYIIFYAKAQQKFILAFLDGNWPIRLRSGQGLIGFVLFEPEGGYILIILL